MALRNSMLTYSIRLCFVNISKTLALSLTVQAKGTSSALRNSALSLEAKEIANPLHHASSLLKNTPRHGGCEAARPISPCSCAFFCWRFHVSQTFAYHTKLPASLPRTHFQEDQSQSLFLQGMFPMDTNVLKNETPIMLPIHRVTVVLKVNIIEVDVNLGLF